MNNMQGLQQKYAELDRMYKRRGTHLAALGQDVQAGQKGVIKDFYVYEEDFSSVAAAGSATGTINIQADSDFVLQKLTYSSDIANAAQTDSSRVIPLMTVQITDSGSGRNLMETAIPVPSLFGTGQIPFILPQTKLFLARTTITVQVSNYSSATPYNLRLSFIGYKVFRGIAG